MALAKALGNDNCKLKFVGLTSNIMGTVALKALMQVPTSPCPAVPTVNSSPPLGPSASFAPSIF